MGMSDVIDLGRLSYRQHGVALDGTPYWIGSTDFAEDASADWKWRHRLGKRCPGPGHGEPECGELIDDDAERCISCAKTYQMMSRGRDPRDAIRERPARDVDPVQYAKELRARVRAKKLVAYARRKEGR